MIRRFGSGYFAITIEIGKPDYRLKEVLSPRDSRGYEIVKLETDSKTNNWTSYVLRRGRKDCALIRGYFLGEDTFHVQRIRNLLADRISGARYIPRLFQVMEEDLRRRGVRLLTSAIYLKLAPIAMKRFGFTSLNGESVEEIRKSFLRRIPLAWKPFKKHLD